VMTLVFAKSVRLSARTRRHATAGLFSASRYTRRVSANRRPESPQSGSPGFKPWAFVSRQGIIADDSEPAALTVNVSVGFQRPRRIRCRDQSSRSSMTASGIQKASTLYGTFSGYRKPTEVKAKLKGWNYRLNSGFFAISKLADF
jgi:hypothetical protein